MQQILHFITLVSALLLISCSSQKSGKLADGREDWPKKLNYAYSPSQENPEGRLKYSNALVDYIGEYIGIPVRLYETGSYGPTIMAMRSGMVDIAQSSPMGYMIASEKTDVEPLVTRGYQDGNNQYRLGSYHSLIVVPADSPYNSIEDLKNDAANITFTFVDVASTSGHLVPRNALEKLGVSPEADFKQVVFTQNQLNSIMTLSAGKVEAGAIMERVIKYMALRGKLDPSEIKTIWKSEPVMSTGVYVRDELPRSLKEEIRNAYLDMKKLRPDIIEMRVALYPGLIDPDLSYIPAYDHMWDELREIAKNIESMNLIEGRPGRNDWNEEKRQAYIAKQQALLASLAN